MRSVKPLLEYFECRRLSVIVDHKRKNGKYSDDLLDDLVKMFDSVYLYLDNCNISVWELSENIEKFALEPIFSFDSLSDYFDSHNDVIFCSLHEDLLSNKNKYIASIHNELASLKYFHFVDVIANLLAGCLRDIVEDKVKTSTVSQAYASLSIAKTLRVYEIMGVHFREVYEKQNAAQTKIYEELRSCLEDFELDECINSIVANGVVSDYHEVVEMIFAEIETKVFRPSYDSTEDGKGNFDKWSRWGMSMINFYYAEKINCYL